MNDTYNIMSHHHHHQPDPVAINGNLKECIPIIFPAFIDYDYVNPIFLNHLPSPLEYYDDHHHDYFQHNNNHVNLRTTAGGVGDATAHDLSFWGGDDDHHHHEKASAGTLESLVDQATRLVPTCPVSAITYYGGDIKIINDDDDMISTCFGYNNPQQIISSNMATTPTTTMAVNDILVLTNDTHGLEIEEHRNNKKKEGEIYNEAVEKDNYAEAVEIEHRRQASLFTYAAAATNGTQSSVREGRKKTEKCSTSSSTYQSRSKTTILHNKAERKRRNKINQRMEALKRLVPNICHKTDKATIIDQVIEYIKKLQTERDQLMMMMMMSSYGMNNNMTYPMIIQMSMMADDAQMGMGVDLGSIYAHKSDYASQLE